MGLRSVADAQIGALTFIQRADSSLRLNVYFHTLVLDGVYVRDDAGELATARPWVIASCSAPTLACEHKSSLTRASRAVCPTRPSPTLGASTFMRGRPSTVVIVDGSSGDVAMSRCSDVAMSRCRDVAQPPVSQERLSQAPDGQRLMYSFKRAWKDGSYAVVLDPLDLLTRLAFIC